MSFPEICKNTACILVHFTILICSIEANKEDSQLVRSQDQLYSLVEGQW